MSTTPELAARAGLAAAEGLAVTAVEKNSPAEQAGIQKGFIVLSINDRRVEDLAGAARILYFRKKNEVVRLGIIIPRPLRRAVVELRAR